MTITEIISDTWKDIKLDQFKPNYPQSTNPDLPRNYGVYLICGSRNSGKTYNTVQIIRNQELSGVYDKKKRKVPIRTILISPTAEQNIVFNSLESLDPDDIHLHYSDELIQDIVDDIKRVKQEAEDYEEKLELYNKMIKAKNLNDLTMEQLMTLSFMNFLPPEKPAFYPAPLVNLILDDLIGSQALRQGKNPVINLILRNRHIGTNVFILGQSIKSIPKPIRNNASVFMIFRYCNADMVKADIYEEVSNVLTEDEFIDIYNYSTEPDDKTPYPFLLLDFSKSKDKLMRKGFTRYLSVNKNDNI